MTWVVCRWSAGHMTNARHVAMDLSPLVRALTLDREPGTFTASASTITIITAATLATSGGHLQHHNEGVTPGGVEGGEVVVDEADVGDVHSRGGHLVVPVGAGQRVQHGGGSGRGGGGGGGNVLLSVEEVGCHVFHQGLRLGVDVVGVWV